MLKWAFPVAHYILNDLRETRITLSLWTNYRKCLVFVSKVSRVCTDHCWFLPQNCVQNKTWFFFSFQRISFKYGRGKKCQRLFDWMAWLFMCCSGVVGMWANKVQDKISQSSSPDSSPCFQLLLGKPRLVIGSPGRIPSSLASWLANVKMGKSKRNNRDQLQSLRSGDHLTIEKERV